MTDLSEVAADVAQALGLKQASIAQEPVWEEVNIKDSDEYNCLLWDGSNLASEPYWRCRCEDWLRKEGWGFNFGAVKHYSLRFDGDDLVDIDCPWPEAPARLMSAVWRKMKNAEIR